MSYIRTEEHRLRQAERIKQWRPWERSTGPKTPEGKRIVSRNARKTNGMQPAGCDYLK